MKSIFARIAELEKKGISFALATIIKTSGSTPAKPRSHILVFPDGRTEGTVGGGALEKSIIYDSVLSLKKGNSTKKVYRLEERGMLCGGKAEVFIQTFSGVHPRLIIFGGGHIAQRLGPMASLAGIPYWVVDDRKGFANRQRFPDAEEVVHSSFKTVFPKLPIDKNTFLVIVTYAHKADALCLEKALQTKASYIGMIGSSSKVTLILDRIEKKGLKVKKDQRVYTPIGLDIGDHTPGEIAVSILAEIIKIKSKGSGKHMRL
jgi:xanthine dehydrogenase accessory factor